MSDIDSDSVKEMWPIAPEIMDESSFDAPSTSPISTRFSRINSTGTQLDSGSNSDNALPLILSPEYFIIIDKRLTTPHQRMSNGVIASCQVCKTKIAGSTRVTSNFLQHYKKKHPDLHQKYIGEKKGQTTSRTKRKHSNFDDKVLKFVIATFSPLSIVEKPEFVSLFDGTHLVVKSRSFISDLLDDKYNEMVLEIKQNLSKVEHLCCTADIWTGRRESFFGYTCHWIHNDFKRKSCVLACRRFEGSHTYLRIADIISTVHTQFGITDEQLVATITDNGSNFINAFKEFGIQCDVTANKECIDSECGLEDDDTMFESSLIAPQLSKHVRSASHTLNLLATTDFINALRKMVTLYENHQYTMRKCAQIWNRYYRPKAAEMLHEILSVTLKTPTVTRWNSLYDAIENLLSYLDKIGEITQVLGVECFVLSEIEYLQEYCLFMKPIAESLDFMQKERDIYLGYLAPTLLTLKAKMMKFFSSPNTKYLKDISDDMNDALFERFRSFFELQSSCHDIVVAAITCPAVKILNSARLLKIWEKTAPNCSAAYLTEIFIKKAIESGPLPMHFNERRSPGFLQHPCFSLEDSDEDDAQQVTTDNSERFVIMKELKGFLENENKSMNILNEYPIITHMFCKFNTPLPSSAPVERLFSFARIVNQSHRQSFTDDHFEKLVIMKANN